ncbi:MAG: hypothetical protein J7L55_04345 [Desulfurococcales archaeon]|nr:hypothetical protein [Desulfurococcales archaeon]
MEVSGARYRTSVFFTCYEEETADELVRTLKAGFPVLSSERSQVLKELYHVLIDGKHPEVEEILEGRTLWHKVDILEFK